MLRRVVSAGVSLLAVLCLLVPPASAGRAERDLERIFERSDFSVSARAQVGRAYEAALAAGAGRREARDLLETGLEGGFSGPQAARLLTLLAQLELSDLPCEEFVSKVEEGVSKGVEPSRVLAAAERRALSLKRAENVVRSLVLHGHDADELRDLIPEIATALESGVREGELKGTILEALEDGERIGKIRRKLLR